MADDPLFLIWSNQKTMWWRANESGYTQYIEEAGRYSGEDVERIVANATCDWQLSHDRVDPVTGETYVSYDEAAVFAPESFVVRP